MMAQLKPPCRVGASPEELRREADRAVLYGACLKLLRPETRIKPELADAVTALAPAVQALFDGQDGADARFARDYAAACGASAFLEGKLREYRRRHAPYNDTG
jgi:hypothetical protein